MSNQELIDALKSLLSAMPIPHPKTKAADLRKFDDAVSIAEYAIASHEVRAA